jgi:methanogenic corrinoid protein MtbC1
MKKKGDKNQHAWLVKAIETQVIPRLMLAHKSDREKVEFQALANRNKHIFSKEAIHDFTQVLLNNDADISKTYVEALIDEGVNLEDIYLELFQPSARLLGTIWEEDTEDFSAVTLALWKMQQTMYYFSDSFLSESQLNQRKGTVFLCPYPGSQHSMGLFMVSEFFRKDNWNVLGDPSITSNELKTKISNNFYDILGISIGSLSQVDGLSTLIKRLRKTSKNPHIFIMIGGPMALKSPNLFNNVGADAQASNAKDAILQATDLMEGRKKHNQEKQKKLRKV